MVSRTMVLVNGKLNCYVKEIVMSGNVLCIIEKWKYKYGLMFHRCDIWVELDICSVRLSEFMKTFTPKPKRDISIKAKPYRTMLNEL